jgi:hypothetical protein
MISSFLTENGAAMHLAGGFVFGVRTGRTG